MELPIIPADADFLVWAVLFVCVGAGFWSQRHTTFGRKYSGIMVTMMLAMLLSNLGIIPTRSEVYDVTWEAFLLLAMPMLLFHANLRVVIRDSGPLLIAFGIGVVGVIIGAVIATALVPLGEITAPVAGMLTATYTGGSHNLAAVALAADFKDGSTLTAIVAADIIATNLHIFVLMALPGLAFVHRHFPIWPGEASPVADGDNAVDTSVFRVSDLDLVGLAYALATAAVIAGAGILTANYFGNPGLAIVFATIYALMLANFAPKLVAKFSGDTAAANFLLFIFLAALAASADVWVLAELGLTLFMYIGIMLAVHLLVLLFAGYLLKIEISSLVIASLACAGGATMAGAISSSKGWNHLVTPGILVGMFGNAVGTFIGVAVWQFYL
jgi:uncharacterized membrane protein